ncbi:Ada metal-binding domain-containing protein [Pseudoflavonifractor sp. MSJ-30]|uniref:Ada metal-binding domain-containing protein n=1 Tax=Pseudoflavonifractor sp. MSJ-30 TaxID=2841525 RepID=UPI00209F5E59|nr:Ada metal-binding domain-containing protein [Pseudoflavonifractor sp. MSJ-30]
MKAKHFLPLLAAVIAACALILGLGGKKTTKGTLPPAVPSVSTTAPRQTEETETTAGTAAATATSAAAEPTETTEAAAETTKAETTVPETEAPATAPETRSAGEEENERDYVANKNTLKFHYPTCSSVEKIKPSNRWDFHGTREELIAKGYAPCKRCSP